MYTEIEIDGKIKKIRIDIPEEETGVVIRRPNLEDTIDLSKELEELKNESPTD